MTMEADSLPEPNADWDGTAQHTLGWLWPAHYYLFAVLFIILCLVTIIGLVLNPRSRQKKHFVKTIMLGSIVVLSICRSMMLLVDPYLSNRNTSMWWTFGYVLVMGLGTSSLTTSLAILLYITAISTRMKSKPRLVVMGHYVCGVTIANFVFFITSDVVSILWKNEGQIMLIVCQVTFACWGILVSAGFATIAHKLRNNARATFEQAKCNINMKNERDRLRTLEVLLVILSVIAASFFALRIYESISGLKTDKYLDTWPWWAMQTAMRSLEIINAVVLLLIFRKQSSKRRDSGRRTNSGIATWKNSSKSITEVMVNQITVK